MLVLQRVRRAGVEVRCAETQIAQRVNVEARWRAAGGALAAAFALILALQIATLR